MFNGAGFVSVTSVLESAAAKEVWAVSEQLPPDKTFRQFEGLRRVKPGESGTVGGVKFCRARRGGFCSFIPKNGLLGEVAELSVRANPAFNGLGHLHQLHAAYLQCVASGLPVVVVPACGRLSTWGIPPISAKDRATGTHYLTHLGKELHELLCSHLTELFAYFGTGKFVSRPTVHYRGWSQGGVVATAMTGAAVEEGWTVGSLIFGGAPNVERRSLIALMRALGTAPPEAYAQAGRYNPPPYAGLQFPNGRPLGLVGAMGPIVRDLVPARRDVWPIIKAFGEPTLAAQLARLVPDVLKKTVVISPEHDALCPEVMLDRLLNPQGEGQAPVAVHVLRVCGTASVPATHAIGDLLALFPFTAQYFGLSTW